MKYSKCLVLLLSAFSLLPFLAFSSKFTDSDNPIVLPTSTDRAVLDVNGRPLEPVPKGQPPNFDTQAYSIISTGRGAAGGDVYLFFINSSVDCPYGVYRGNSDVGGRPATPVVFRKRTNVIVVQDIVTETDEVTIEFIGNLGPCPGPFGYFPMWKVGDYDESIGGRLLEAGGFVNESDGSLFKIVKTLHGFGYTLQYCPGPYECHVVSQVIQNGNRRLAIVKDGPRLSWNFKPFP